MSGFPLSLLINQVFHVDTERGVTDVNQGQDTNQALFDLLNNLSSGETILGKIVSSDENSYTFKTDNNVTINARAEKGVSLEPGTSVLFEVKKNGNTFSLRPLSTNVNASKTAAMALNQAGIPVNARTLEMTVRNMEYGKSVDRQSLQEAYRDVALNPETPVKVIVDLQEMNIPVTKDNIVQYMAYTNSEESVVKAFDDIADKMAEEFTGKIETVLAEKPDISADAPVVKLINVLTSDKVLPDKLNLLSEEKETVASNSPIGVNDEADVHIGELVKALKGIVEDSLPEDNNNLQEKDISKLPSDTTVNSNTVQSREKSNPLPKVLTGISTFSELEEKLKPVLKEIFRNTMSKDYTVDLKSEDLKGDIKNLYEKLFSDTEKLSKVIEEVFPKESPVNTAIHNLSSNIDFMNSLNTFVPFIQIPFASEGGNKAGELYVYRNKHGLTEPEGELTAFVHLDTDHLGPCDVYIKLKLNNVTTHFTLQDEESLDFLEAHLDFLNKRLADKGYVFEASFEQKEKEKSVIEELLEMNSQRIMISKQSFDARV